MRDRLLLLSRCSNALYTRLVFDNVVLWRSYFRRHMTYLAPSVDACINQLLERIELQHGRLFVSHAFAYITVSKEGLTESELEDVLSLDEQVGDQQFLFTDRITFDATSQFFCGLASFARNASKSKREIWYWPSSDVALRLGMKPLVWRNGSNGC